MTSAVSVGHQEHLGMCSAGCSARALLSSWSVATHICTTWQNDSFAFGEDVSFSV